MLGRCGTALEQKLGCSAICATARIKRSAEWREQYAESRGRLRTAPHWVGRLATTTCRRRTWLRTASTRERQSIKNSGIGSGAPDALSDDDTKSKQMFQELCLWLSEEGTKWTSSRQRVLESRGMSEELDKPLPVDINWFDDCVPEGRLRGIVATQGFVEGELIFQIPATVVFNVDKEAFTSDKTRVHWGAIFAAKLVEEKRLGQCMRFGIAAETH